MAAVVAAAVAAEVAASAVAVQPYLLRVPVAVLAAEGRLEVAAADHWWRPKQLRAGRRRRQRRRRRGARRDQRAGAAQKREQENSGPKGDAHVFLGEQHKLQEVQQRGGFKPACVLYLGPFHTITLPD